jgi:hypothetical protein
MNTRRIEALVAEHMSKKELTADNPGTAIALTQCGPGIRNTLGMSGEVILNTITEMDTIKNANKVPIDVRLPRKSTGSKADNTAVIIPVVKVAT